MAAMVRNSASSQLPHTMPNPPTRLLDKRWPWLLAASVLLVVLVASLLQFRSRPDDHRPSGSADDIAALKDRSDLNVLFIVIDTLRADRLGSYGYHRDTSPTLDGLAAQGVRFARHMSQSSWTKASMASLWSGLYPARAGINRFDDVIPDAAQLPAEILKQSGFRTIGLYRNGWVAPTFGFQQGFDVYLRPAPGRQPPSLRIANPTLKLRGTDEDAVAAAVEFLRVEGDKRWFLYLHLMDVHEYVYDEESALFGGTYSDIYDNAIRWTDGTLAVLWEYLAEWGYLENTLIAVASDHGEAFRERGLEGHARTLYRETTEVPFLLSFPFKLAPGVVVDGRSRNVDIWPTLFDLLGIAAPPDLDGRSLVPELLASARGGAAPADERTAFAQLDQNWGKKMRPPRPTVAVSDGMLRYVRATDERGQLVERLFDATNDPGELNNRAGDEPEDLERLRGMAETYLENEPYWGETPTREVGEMELNQLRALGYAIP
jgi:arylsulfatase A-like enzyme